MDRRIDPGAGEPEEVQLPERYAILRCIKLGGTATVWRAYDKLLGRDVAIKLLAERFAGDQLAIRRFKREALAAARLSAHPHVVTIYDVGEARSPQGAVVRPFIVMEHLAGGSVADAMRLAPASLEEALRWLRQAAAAVDYAHARGVLHRDVKPANLLLDRERLLYVADFGIAQLGAEEDGLTEAGQVIGTAAYLPPERALGRPATEASDRYALAVVAFELLVGARPFSAATPEGLARAHVEVEPPSASDLNPALPRTLDPVLARGLAKRSERRWPSSQELVAAIELAASGVPIRTVRSLRLGNRAIPSSRRPGRIAALAAVAAAAFAVGIVTGAGHGGTPAHLRTSASHAGGALSHPAPPRAFSASRSKLTNPMPAAAETTSSAPAAPPPAAEILAAHGHELMLAGDYGPAIAALRMALGVTSPASATYAYALFDLGRSLRLAGEPRAAIPVLWQRLQIPVQTDTVRMELELALRTVGSQAQAAWRASAARRGSAGGGAARQGGPGGRRHAGGD